VVVRGDLEVNMTDWQVPTANAMPMDAFWRGGLIWYAAERANLLGSFNPKTQKFEEFHLIPGTDPDALIPHSGSGPQSTMNFVPHAGFIGEYDPTTRRVREFPIEGSKLLLHGITYDRNGNIWFTALNAKPPQFPRGSEIGFLAIPSTDIRLAETPTPNANPYDLAVDSRNVLFFTESDNPKLGSINPVTMKITEYPFPHAESRARGLAITPDDAVWYSDYARGYLGRFDPKTGQFREWPSPSGPKSRPFAITKAGDVIWYTESGTTPNMLVRFDPETQKFQSWVIPARGGIRYLYPESDSSLWFASPVSNAIVHVTIKDQAK
jgi:virginiamycin B lyase